jgi:hypothetical protein
MTITTTKSLAVPKGGLSTSTVLSQSSLLAAPHNIVFVGMMPRTFRKYSWKKYSTTNIICMYKGKLESVSDYCSCTSCCHVLRERDSNGAQQRNKKYSNVQSSWCLRVRFNNLWMVDGRHKIVYRGLKIRNHVVPVLILCCDW